MRSKRITAFIEVEEEYRKKYCPRLLCVLLLDSSGSMRGDSLVHLNELLQTFQNDLSGCWLSDNCVLEIAIVSFNSEVQTLLKPTLREDFVDMLIPSLTAEGFGDIKGGVLKAMEIVNQRKQQYKELGIKYRRPWVVMITDGEGIDEEIEAVSSQIKDDCRNQYFIQPIVLSEATTPKDIELLNSLTTGQTILVPALNEFRISCMFSHEFGHYGGIRLTKQFLEEEGYSEELEYLEKGFPQEDYYSHLCHDGPPPFYDDRDPIVKNHDIDIKNWENWQN